MKKSKLLAYEKANKVLNINEGKLDRYIKYYLCELEREPNVEGKPFLNDTERDMLNKYERVYEMFDLGRTDTLIRSFLIKEYHIQERQARYIIEEARIIYGITGKADKEGKKRASINYYRTLSNLAFKAGDIELAGKLNSQADKLEGLFDPEQIGLDPEMFMRTPNVFFVDKMEVANKNRLDYDE
jgi:hypothetical protein